MDIIILLILIGIIAIAIAIIATAFIVYINMKIKTEKELVDIFSDYFDQFETEEVKKEIEKMTQHLEKICNAFNGWTKMGREFNKTRTAPKSKKNPNKRNNSPKV